MRDQQLSFPCIVYLQPEVANLFSFAAWNWASLNGIIVSPIPACVFNWLGPSNLGVFTHVLKKMHPYLMKGYVIMHM